MDTPPPAPAAPAPIVETTVLPTVPPPAPAPSLGVAPPPARKNPAIRPPGPKQAEDALSPPVQAPKAHVRVNKDGFSPGHILSSDEIAKVLNAQRRARTKTSAE